MKPSLELLYGLGAAGLLVLAAMLASTDLATSNGLVAQFVWRGPWLIPYVSYLLATWHRRRQGSKDKALGIQFIVTLWTIGFAALLTAIIAGIGFLMGYPTSIVSSSVVMTIGLWEGAIKGLFFSIATTLVFDRLRPEVKQA